MSLLYCRAITAWQIFGSPKDGHVAEYLQIVCPQICRYDGPFQHPTKQENASQVLPDLVQQEMFDRTIDLASDERNATERMNKLNTWVIIELEVAFMYIAIYTFRHEYQKQLMLRCPNRLVMLV
jgi:hypothetical protein